MTAKYKASYDENRTCLADVLPLTAPYTIYIEPTKICNFKCFYCMHSTRDMVDGIFSQTGYKTNNIDESLFDKIVKEIMEFPVEPKRIVFSGLGEPLCNKKLPEMISKLRQANFTGRIDMITNGALLNKALSDRLITAGVSRIQISLQGINGDQYEKNCGYKMDYEKFVDELTYLYSNKQDTSIFIKIIDALVDNKEDKDKFFVTFEPICDTIFIEHLIVLQQEMGDHNGIVDKTKNFNNEEFKSRDVCPVTTYHLQISAEGYTFPCPVPGLPTKFSLGNVNETTLLQIWNGAKRKGLIRSHLMKNKNKMEVCGTCFACAAVLDENENLDDRAHELLKLF